MLRIAFVHILLLQVLPEYEHIYMLYIEELDRIVQETKHVAINVDEHGLTGDLLMHKLQTLVYMYV